MACDVLLLLEPEIKHRTFVKLGPAQVHPKTIQVGRGAYRVDSQPPMACDLLLLLAPHGEVAPLAVLPGAHALVGTGPMGSGLGPPLAAHPVSIIREREREREREGGRAHTSASVFGSWSRIPSVASRSVKLASGRSSDLRTSVSASQWRSRIPGLRRALMTGTFTCEETRCE